MVSALNLRLRPVLRLLWLWLRLLQQARLDGRDSYVADKMLPEVEYASGLFTVACIIVVVRVARRESEATVNEPR